MLLTNPFKSRPEFKEVDPVKIYYNVGALLDHPTGNYVKGAKGENILNGGLGVLTAIAGKGNTFKSTIANYMLFSAASKVCSGNVGTYINIYDTEMNARIDRLSTLAKRFPEFTNVDISNNQMWCVTDKTLHTGNEWYKLLKDFLRNEKIKNKTGYTLKTPIVDSNGTAISTIIPSFGEIDSVSEFDTADIEEMQDKNELGESGGNTIHMRLGLAKTRLLMELPGLCNSSGHYMVMTAHLGADIPMQSGPYAVPTKKLQHLKMGDKIKGVTDKFFFLPNIFWQTVNSSTLMNQSTKGPEYPKTRDDKVDEASDLNIVTLKQLRNKSGPSGNSIDIIVSQTEGVLPSLTEFHYIKENNRYGLDGNLINYNLVLYPDVKLGRTTIRNLIDTDPLLRRAIKITSDLHQMAQMARELNIVIPPLQDLYAKLDKQYGMKLLLNTRDYWTFNQYTHEVPFLSSMDILEMYYDRYIPYWLTDSGKPSKKK